MTGCYKERNGLKNDGCATFFRTDKFEKISAVSLCFEEGMGLV